MQISCTSLATSRRSRRQSTHPPRGDEIHVAPGIYREHISSKNKSITLIGAGIGETILSGDLDADGTPDGKIVAYDNEGVDVLPFLTIEGVTFTETTRAIEMYRAADIEITDCHFDTCDAGLGLLWYSPGEPLALDVTFQDCRFTNGGHGIHLENAVSLTLNNCEFQNQTDSSVLAFVEVAQVDSVLVQDNTGSPIAISAHDGEVTNSTFHRNSSGTHLPGLFTSASCMSIHTEGTFTIDNCDFTENHIGIFGHPSLAFDAPSGEVHITNSRFVGNDGSSESAVHVRSTAHFADCLFSNNTARGVGPINFLATGDTPSSITRCSFINNGRYDADEDRAYPGGGGGLCIESGAVVISDSLFKGNVAASAGAVMIAGSRIDCVIQRCRFDANRAHYLSSRNSTGGAISSDANSASQFVVSNSTFIGNNAKYGLGGAISSRHAPTITNCAFIENKSDLGSAMYLDSREPNPADLLKPTASVFVQGNAASMFDSQIGPFSLVNNDNLELASAQAAGFVRAPNDGGDGFGDDPTTPDIDEGANDDFGDLRLAPLSPAIDAGNNATIPRDLNDLDNDSDTEEPITGYTDLDGNPRFVDTVGMPNIYPGNDFGSPIDLGPYEFRGHSCLGDINQDGSLTPADFNEWINAFNNNQPPADQNRDGDINAADFTAWIANFNTGC